MLYGHDTGEVLYRGVCDIRNAIKLWEEPPTYKAALDKEYKRAVLLFEPKSDGVCYGVLLVK